MPQMKLHVLFVEASQVDLQQTLAKLAEHGYQVEYQRVDDADTMKTALLMNQNSYVGRQYLAALNSAPEVPTRINLLRAVRPAGEPSIWSSALRACLKSV